MGEVTVRPVDDRARSLSLVPLRDPQPARRRRPAQLLPLCGVLALLTSGALLAAHWPFRYRNVQPLLERVFAGHVAIDRYRLTYFPYPGLIAEGLTLRRNSAPDLPPVGTANRLVIQGRWQDLLLLRRRVHRVEVDGFHVVIPAIGTLANHEDFPPGSTMDFTGPTTAVDQFEIRDATLDLMRTSGSRYSFPIHRILIGNLEQGHAVSYTIDMQSPEPSGHIEASGSFGPVLGGRLGATPVSGSFRFAPLILSQIHGLNGQMTVSGSFGGVLLAMRTQITTATPDFAVGTGTPTGVAATALVTVNALNGDVHFNTFDAITGATTVHAVGDVAGTPKITNFDITVDKGRAQDLLTPFLHTGAPISGDIRLHSHAYLGASEPGVRFLDRLRMDGAFLIPSERFTNRRSEQKLSQFSSRAQGERSTPGTAADVFSSLGGGISIQHGIASTRRLSFQVPGASVNLHGIFSLRNGDARLLGDLHMLSDISHMTTGFKSKLLKPFAPFFRQQGLGAVVPIAILRENHHYRVTTNLLHHQESK